MAWLSPSTMLRNSTRTVVTLVLVGTLVLTAGCTGVGLGDGETGAAETEEPTDETTPADGATETADGQTDAAESEASDDGHGHDHSHGDGGDAADGDGTEATTADATEITGESDAGDGESTASQITLEGKMTLAVNGSELDLQARDEGDDAFDISDSDEHTWTANRTDLTLADALSRLDVEASAGQIAVDGEQYARETEGTRLSYRVDGEPVDPEEYVLEHGDQVWITVRTAETNVSGPGTYIKADQQHAHGEMTFVVEGEELDFSREKYQGNHQHFHYEHGDGELWHAHSTTVTLAFALSSLEGIDVDGDAIEYEGTTYDPDDGASVEVSVNGDPVDPTEYVLKDGDSVRVVVGEG